MHLALCLRGSSSCFFAYPTCQGVSGNLLFSTMLPPAFLNLQYLQVDSLHHLALQRLHRQAIYSLYPLHLIDTLNRASLYPQECAALHHQAAVPIPHPRIHLYHQTRI